VKKKKKSKRQKQFFTSELKRFRNVTEMKGEEIGEKGGVALGRELLAGVCPRMAKLDLSWNFLKFQGTAMLLDAFGRGAAAGITYLDLRANHIDERGIAGLRKAMDKGALPNMTHLDIRQNSFGDEGAKIVAHMVLSGVLGNLEVLRCDSCQIRDIGMGAMYKAFSAQSIKFLMPHLEYVSVKNNHPSSGLMKRMDLIPKHFSKLLLSRSLTAHPAPSLCALSFWPLSPPSLGANTTTPSDIVCVVESWSSVPATSTND